MFRKFVACLVLAFAIVVLAAIAPRLQTLTWQALVAVASTLVGLIGAVGLLRAWPFAHQMAGLFLLVIGGVIISNAVERHATDGRSIYPAAAALLCLALVICDYLKTRTR